MYRLKYIVPTITTLSLSYHYSCNTTLQNKNIPQFKFKSRAEHLQDVTKDNNYDVVIIGGGCNGTGVLLDASTRGLRTLMIEKDDFASGASSKSTKLIHGGVRYLQQVFSLSTDSISSRIDKFKLVKQAIIERSFMIDSAEHLTTKIPFVIPAQNIFQGFYYYIGSVLYYAIYSIYAPKTETIFNFPFFFNREELTSAFPKISPKYDIGVVYEDGSFNDSRLLLSAVLTATVGNRQKMPPSFKPANALNKAQFIDFVKDENGNIVGVIFKDLVGQKIHQVNAKYVVNCTGVWADKIRLKDNPNVKKRICAVGGSHITYDNQVANRLYGICAPSPDGRVILVVPWLNRVIAGTTERKFDEPTNNPCCSEEQRNMINKVMMDIMEDLDTNDFFNYQTTRWSGLRPLVVDDATQETKKIARTHVVERSTSGLYSLMGGKWTTYRKMGEDLVNQICKDEKEKGRNYPQSQTKNLKLIGSAPKSLKLALSRVYGDIGSHLYSFYGSFAQEILKGNLTRVLGPITIAQLQWIVQNELVNDIEDIILRRTRASFLMGKKEALSLAPVIADIMQKQRKFSDKEKQKIIQESINKILSYEFE